MKTIQMRKQKKTRKIWIPIVLLLILAVGGAGGYWYWTKTKAVSAANATATTMKTSQARSGSITISVSGSGTLVAGQEKAIGFSTSGTVNELKVQVGDKVKKGDVLAVLDNLVELQDDVTSAQETLAKAQQSLADLKANATLNLANAKLAVVEAQNTVDTAKSSLVQAGWTRCDQKTADTYYNRYLVLLDKYNALDTSSTDKNYYVDVLSPAKEAVDKAYALVKFCAGYTNYEIESSQSTLSLDEAKLVQAQATLAALTKSNGVDPLDQAAAENTVTSAELALKKAQDILVGATMTAPFDGTILSVAGKVGDSAGTGAFITIADLAHPDLEFSVDESDLSKVAVGEQANITFDAVENQTFAGKVIRINPALETSGGYQVVKGLIELELTAEQQALTLPKGLNATVELVSATAKNVVLVPLQAVRDLGDGQYGVFVVGSDGQPKLKIVEVGLQDAANAEIKSGVAAGETVSTGSVQTK